MERAPLVSCIVIFLDAERYLQQAIDSILAQTYGNWELFLVDDGSSDSSTAIARRAVAAQADRIRYLEHPGHGNRGMSASRNLGAASARGEYLAFLDADDVWVPQKLSEQVAIMEAQPRAAMLYGRSLIWHSWNLAPDSPADYFCDLGVKPNQMIEPPRLVFLLLENRAQTPTTCNALIRRAVYAELGGFQEEFRGMFEDQAFFTKLCLFYPVYVADACWAWYRQHDQSCCALVEKSGNTEGLRRPLLEWIARYFRMHDIRDPTLVRALRRELAPLRHPRLYRTFELLRQWGRRAKRRGRAAFKAMSLG